jgi:hypothetical protein
MEIITSEHKLVEPMVMQV